MMKIYITAILVFIFYAAHSQTNGRLTLYGKVLNKSNTVNAVFIEVYKDNELVIQVPNLKNGAFRLELNLGHVYNINFSKSGFIDKSVAVVAKTDSITNINGRYFFQLDIELFKVDQDEVDESVLPPVAKLYIRDQEEGFQYDKKYVRWVAGHYED